MNELQRFLQITQRLNKGLSVPSKDLEFYSSFTGGMDDSKLAELNDKIAELKQQGKIDADLSAEAIGLAIQNLQSNPDYREQLLQLKEKQDAGKLSEDIAGGLNILLAGTDIATSANQIAKSNQQLARARRPGKPAIPPRDQYLQQALRGAQEGNYGVSQTLAPVRAEINDNYLSDLQNAKTASTGQAGAYGSYAQAAANRRNRAALDIGSLANQVRQQNQSNYNDLIGQRLGETQRMFDNQSQFYGADLDQYNNEMRAAGQLGSIGRSNLRESLGNLGQFASQQGSKILTSRRYKNLYNNLRNLTPNSADRVMDSINYNDSIPNENNYI